MKRKQFRRKALFIFLSLGLITFLLIYNSRSVQVNEKDQHYLELFLRDWHLNLSRQQVHKDFNSELNFISTMHDSIIAEIRQEGIPHEFFGDVSFYYKNRKGFCYDRSVLMEKFLTYYHFPFRHAYLYFGDNNKTTSVFNIFKKNLPSHALTEINTSKGWMVMGSNSNWLGIDSSGNLLTIGKLQQEMQLHHLNLQKRAFIGMKPFWLRESDFKYIYGIYSRHGDFFSHKNAEVSASSIRPDFFHILPDYNLKMLFYNLQDN